MLTRERYAQLLESFPFLAGASPPLATEMRGTLRRARLPAGRNLFQPGDRATSLPLLLSGGIRVYLLGRNGREITLYRFDRGEACLLSANAILADNPLPAAAVVEERAEAVLVPAAALRSWVGEHALWRDFVFALNSRRLSEVLGIVDAVVFQRMDARVATLLLERGGNAGPLRITHQEIAAELGTSREVVSRIVESLAGTGVLRVGRGRIEVLSPDALAAFAAA
jgi:CRP/FNR family transcriptional regulator